MVAKYLNTPPTHRQCPHHLHFQNRQYEILLLLLFHTFSAHAVQHLNITIWSVSTLLALLCKRELLLLLFKLDSFNLLTLLAALQLLPCTACTSSLTHLQLLHKLLCTFRDVFVVGHSTSKRQLKNKRENATSRNKNNNNTQCSKHKLLMNSIQNKKSHQSSSSRERTFCFGGTVC